jgi:TonB-linked SusC/RagA family outer membrane protein
MMMKKLLRFLLLMSLLMVSARGYAQDAPVSLRAENMPLEQLFVEIEKQTNVKFFYRSENVVGKTASVNVAGIPLKTVLRDVLTPHRLKYSLMENSLIVIEPEVGKAAADGAGAVAVITGTVADPSGKPLVGATIAEKGTTNGAVSDAAGKFNLRVAKGAKVVVSYLGYLPQEITVSGQSELNIALVEVDRVLDEVVVVGYGTQRKGDVSTSISSVRFGEIGNQVVSDFRTALVGRMPGVQVLQSTGDPNSNLSIRVRGISTITAGSEPLYVLDGIPIMRGQLNINDNDIESIDVLKDASAAAIYGSRGSNGVILITTKKAKTDRLSVQYDGYYGWQSVTKKMEMLDAYQFAELAKDGHDGAYLDVNPNGSPDDPNSVRPNSWERIPAELFPYLDGVPGLTNTDWQDAIFRVAPTTNHNVSVAGKSENINYFASLGYLKRDGIVIGSDLERYSARLNLDAKYNKFKFYATFSPSYSFSNRVDASGSNGIVKSALMMPPTFPVYNDDGSFNFQGNGYWRIGTDYQHQAVMNPVAMAYLQSDELDRLAIVGKMTAEYEFFKGFSYSVSLGGDYYGTYNATYQQSGLPLLGHQYYDNPSNPVGNVSTSFYTTWMVENKLSYNTLIAGKHSINAILVQSAEKETGKLVSATATDYANDYIQSLTGGVVNNGTSSTPEWSIASYLARAQYAYEGKYLVSAAIRADGSSRFGAQNRWGYFPSASAAWRLSDEGFFKNIAALAIVDDLKFRVSYGETGNFNIGNYDHIPSMGIENYILGTSDGILTPGYKTDNIKNDELKWEKNTMTNVGFELQMFKGLLGVSVEYYNSNTSDMLLSIPVPHTPGQSTALVNIGSANNRGWEFMLSSRKRFGSGIEINLSANLANNTNKVSSLGPEDAPLISSGSVASAYYITQVGQPIGNYYVLVQDGIFATSEQLNLYPHFSDTRVGDVRFVDVDGDGVLDVDKDRTIVGNYMPDFTYGLSGSVSFKGVDLSFNFQGVYGNEILNLQQYHINNMEGSTNNMVESLNRWHSETEPGDGQTKRANRKATGNNQRISTWHIEDGSYLRLQNISLGYTLPQDLTRKIRIEKLRIYVSGQNLWTLTGYRGFNPEVNARPTVSTTPGEDFGTYPLAKIITTGINLTF